eukprot:Gb_23735 [translate_table: standard]
MKQWTRVIEFQSKRTDDDCCHLITLSCRGRGWKEEEERGTTGMVHVFFFFFSFAGDEVGGEGPGVVVDGVGEVVGEVLDGAFAGDDGLDEETEHGEHGQAAVLELLNLQFGEGIGVVGQPQRVEAATWIDGVGNLAEWAASNAVALDGSHEDDLAGPDGENALGVDEAWVAQVVEAAVAEDLRARLEPDSLAELDAVAGEQLREDAAQGSQHRPPRVDHLQLSVLRERLRVRRQPRRVPPVVSRKFSRQI